MSFQAFPRAHVPDTHGLVEAARHHQVGLGVEVATECIVRVTLQRLEALPTRQFPYLESFVITCRHKQARVRTPCHVRNAQFMPDIVFSNFPSYAPHTFINLS